MIVITELRSAGRRRIIALPAAAGNDPERLPHILRISLENVLRAAGRDAPRAQATILDWLNNGRSDAEIPFVPATRLNVSAYQ